MDQLRARNSDQLFQHGGRPCVRHDGGPQVFVDRDVRVPSNGSKWVLARRRPGRCISSISNLGLNARIRT